MERRYRLKAVGHSFEVGLRLGLSQSAASRAAQRGRGLAKESGLSLEVMRNA